MQFIVIAHDYTDAAALERRLACRTEHVAFIDELKAKGHFLHGGAFLDKAENMVGSVLVCDFLSEEALKEIWLNQEPYLLNRVWETVEVRPYRVGPSFI